jgi:hypothetical protein
MAVLWNDFVLNITEVETLVLLFLLFFKEFFTYIYVVNAVKINKWR